MRGVRPRRLWPGLPVDDRDPAVRSPEHRVGCARHSDAVDHRLDGHLDIYRRATPNSLAREGLLELQEVLGVGARIVVGGTGELGGIERGVARA